MNLTTICFSNASSNEGHPYFIEILTDILDECIPENELIIFW